MSKKVHLAFVLSMPGCGSWNGKWSGDGRFFAVTRSVDATAADRIIKGTPYHYAWSDGWRARIDAQIITQPSKIKRKSEGFCGYDWMVDSICQHGKITTSHEEPSNL